MNPSEIAIERITEKNYHKFDDMVAWRINGVESSQEEKRINRDKDFSEALQQLRQEGFYGYGALVEGRYVAWITIIHTPKLGKWQGGVIYVDEIWTAPEYRRRGIAYQLMQKAFEVQTLTNAVRVRLYTDNVPAQRLYKKCGLKVTNHAVFMESE